MGDISEHFDRTEFACRDNCGFDAVDAELLGILEGAHHYFNSPIRVNCGCRCAIHNAHENGSIKSQHLLGKAADISIRDASPSAVADYFDMLFPNKYGIGRYDQFTHIDCRPVKSRWDFRGKQA